MLQQDAETSRFADGLVLSQDDLDYASQIIDAACMAHLRRKFHDVIKLKPSPIADEALSRIGALYISKIVSAHVG